MPRRVDPGEIQVGTGLASNNTLDANAFTAPVANGQTAGLNAHINDPKDAHSASSISIEGDPFYDADDVEGALDELAGLIPPRPPTVGNFSTFLSISGVTDWGVLKLRDAGLGDRGDITFPVPASPNDDNDIYPYYHDVPAFADDSPPFDPYLGDDPRTDETFNVFDGVYTGGGDGTSHLGGYTRPAGGPPNPILQTARVLPSEGLGVKSFLTSGMVFPADRGVLALFYWPPDGGVAEFLAQDLTTRVQAAILLGQGLQGQDPNCDGQPGGIFTVSTADPEDPFTFPGQASGQYDLVELHTGLVGGTGPGSLPAPFGTANPSGGQVRLGQVAEAGVPIVAGGIPILGATTNALGIDGNPFGGNDNNFFRYRLPYLDDYTTATGLKYTPTAEKPRYFGKPAVSLNPGTDLTQGGDYPNLPKDYWHFQLARYRHRATFPTGFPNPPDPRDMGSYIIVHFKREFDFELFARDGIMPNDPANCYHVYSATLTNWLDPEDPLNLTDDTATPAETADGYHVLRALNVEDPEALDPIVVTTNTWDYTRTQDEVMTVSGVHYFVPGGAGRNWQISTMEFNATGYWENTYRLANDSSSGQVTDGINGPDPAFVYLGVFGAEPGVITHAGATDFNGEIETQRIEFGYDDLDVSSGHGPFTLLNGPEPADGAGVNLLVGDPNIEFTGDQDTPFFSQDANTRWFFRSPLGHEAPGTALLPTQGEVLAVADGKTILFHSTGQHPSGGTGDYGNFNSGAIPSVARPALETAQKDYEERFLDEVYRWNEANLFTADPTWDGARGQIAGPGLPFGAAPLLTFPVRAGSAVAPWDAASFLQQGNYLADLTTLGREAQVVGLPDRNPPLADGVVGAQPSSGMVTYPSIDYSNSAAIRPNIPDGDLSVLVQPDYSAVAVPEVVYLRALDVSLSRSASPVVAAGQPFFTLRVRGLRLADFAYAAPGPGSTRAAIEIKVPGLTTWMDAGRVDGAGPSKQDAFNDGAGCQIVGVETLDARDPVTGVWYSDVRVNVGPAVNLYQNNDGEVPVLVRVSIYSGAALDFTQGGPDGTTDTLRAVTGLEIVAPS